MSAVQKALDRLNHPPLSAEARSLEWGKMLGRQVADRYHVDEMWTVRISGEWYLLVSRSTQQYTIHDIVRRSDRRVFKYKSER